MHRIYQLIVISLIVGIATSAVAMPNVEKVVSQAQKGDAQAQYELGIFHEKGNGVAQDFDKALEWYHKAAAQDHIGALIDLGWFYQNGQGVKKDISQAINYYTIAADKGNAQAQLNLAVLYDEGIDVPENKKLATIWYQKSADQGNDVAMLNLGVNYWRGEGVEQNYEKAWNLLNRVRMTSPNKTAQWKARGVLDQIKSKLGITNRELSYPAWENLKK